MDLFTERTISGRGGRRGRAGRTRAARGVAAILTSGALMLGSACGDEPAEQKPGVALPAAFPKAEVPLVDGNVTDASERTQDGRKVFLVTVQAQPGGFDAAKKKLTDAGYLALGDGPDGDTRSAQFSGEGYVITVNSVDGGAIPNAVFYLVSKA